MHRWSHVCLLSTRNIAIARLLTQIIWLKAQFPDHPIKTICFDNASEFFSQRFLDYCMLVGIDVEYPVAHTHTQNGLAESLIKHLQLIARPLLLRTKLSLFAWGHSILHVSTLIRIRLTANHDCSPLQLALGSQPNCETKVWLILILMIIKQGLKLMIIFQVWLDKTISKVAITKTNQAKERSWRRRPPQREEFFKTKAS